jgi:hypothetical protein
MYNLIDNVPFEVDEKITPAKLLALKKFGLYGTQLDGEKEAEKILDLFIDQEKFKELTSVIYKVDKEYDWTKVNLVEWMRGYRSFFLNLVKSFTSSEN